MGWPGIPGSCILGRRYREVVWGWEFRSKEMSVPDKPWEGPAVVVEFLVVGLSGVGC